MKLKVRVPGGALRRSRYAVIGVLPFLLFGCSGSGESLPGARTNGPFEVLESQPADNGKLFLNQSVRWTFSNPIDINTAHFNSIAFSVTDASGNPVSDQVTGIFRYGRDELGQTDPYSLEFVPRLPTNDSYTNGGFRPGRNYTVTIVRTVHPDDPVLRDKWGNSLWEFSPHQSIRFKTASGNTPGELFVDTRFGGPALTGWSVGPKVGDRVSLNRLGTAPVEVVLRFDQPLNPASANVPVGQDLRPEKDKQRNKGRIYLEYDDPLFGDRRWIRARVELPSNDATGATVTLRPDGILPNNATVRVIVAAEVEDISGESNTKDPRYSAQVGTFRTEDSFESQFDALVLEFKKTDIIDQSAAFNDPVAQIEQGLLKASFDFEGIQTGFNWSPTSRQTVLDTNIQQIQPTNGPPFVVTGGVFPLNDIHITKDILVQGKGTNPLVFLCNGTVRIDGRLAVDGGDGDDVHTLNSANFPTAGGTGVCGGGAGGKASQSVTASTQFGEDGFGPNSIPGGGGGGGQIACGGNTTTIIGGGGGGGGMATKGDPQFPASGFIQKTGDGGNGGTTNGKGGKAGPTVFKDATSGNDFWGRLVKDDGTVVVGELKAPAAGAGGGGGGDQTNAANCKESAANFANDRKGGGGGGGGGVLVIKALGPIIVSETGRISADGGRGGGGEWAGSSTYGGGGGAGSGGMVVLMSASRIDLYTHGGTFAGGDYQFSVTADGNISRVSSYTTVRTDKYVGITGNKDNAGGYGGMGVVQLMTPPGIDADNTGTVLDDNIRVLQGTTSLSGSAKTAYLVRGDVRPDPWFLPVSYGRFSSAETRWFSTLFSERRESSTPETAGPRVIDSRTGKAGPEWYFKGLSTTGTNHGYLLTNTNGALDFPPEKLVGGVTRVKIKQAASNAATYYGLKAHVVQLEDEVLPDPKAGGWSYANYRARIFDGQEAKDYRILTHTTDELWLEAGTVPLSPTASDLEVTARFISVETQGVEGLGETYKVVQGTQEIHYPIANIQVGFAFHEDPSNPSIQGNKDLNRLPQEIGEFLYDLDLDNTVLREQLRELHYRFAKVRVRFNLDYTPNSPDTTSGPNPVQPGVERPGIRWLTLPYRF